jgi:tetratricopeptide (TPR) repeat protein
MSLINDMLKNLEKHTKPAVNSNTIGIAELEEEHSLPLTIFCVTIILLFVAGLGFGIFYGTKHYSHSVHQPRKAQLMTPSTLPPANKVIAHNIHINDLPNQTTVTFDLSAPATFLTNFQLATNTEVVTLNNTLLDTDALCRQLGKLSNCLVNNNIPMPVKTSTIQSIHIEKNDGKQLILSFKLISPAQMQNIQLTNNLLTINFSNKKITTMPLPPPLTNDINAGPTDSQDQILQPVLAQPLNSNTKKYDLIYDFILLRQFDRAQEALDKLSPEDYASVNGIMARAKLQLALGNNIKALDILNTYSFNNKNATPEFYGLYAAALEFNGQHTQAALIYKTLVNNAPDNTTWLLGLAISAMNDQQTALAKSTFQHLVDLGNVNPEVMDYVQKKIEAINIENP